MERPARTAGGRRPLRAILRVLAWIGGVILGLVLLVVILFLLPPVRQALLSRGIKTASTHLPGKLAVGTASWPTPEKLVLDDFVWTDRGDTLAAFRRLSIAIDIPGLVRKDLALGELSLERAQADLPAMRAAFAGRPAAPRKPVKKRSFPRDGSIPGVPSVALSDLRIDAPRIVLPDSSSVTGLRVAARIELRAGRVPEIRVDRLLARSPQRGWSADSVRIGVTPAEGRIEAFASGRLLPDWPFLLTVRPTGRNAFHLTLVRSPGDQVPESIGMALDAVLALDGAKLRQADFNGMIRTPGTADLARLPGLQAKLATAPVLEGLVLAARGSVRLRPSFAAGGAIHFLRNDWLEGGVVQVSSNGTATTLDSLRFSLPDLALRANGRMAGDSVSADARLQIRGTRWLSLLQPNTKPPDSLAADLVAHLAGRRNRPGGDLVLRAHARTGKTVLDSLVVDARVPDGWRDPARVNLAARGFGYALRAEAEAALDAKPLEIRLSPIRILDATTVPGPPPPLESTVRLPGPNENLLVRNLRVTGVFGQLQLDADAGRAAPGSFHVHWVLTEPPLSVARMPTLRTGQIDTVRTAWSHEGPFHLDFGGDIAPLTTGPPSIRSSGSFYLPGPAALAVFLPRGSLVNDLGPLQGTAELRTFPAAGGSGISAVLDLGSTAWIDTGRVAIHHEGKVFALDTLHVSLPGLRAVARASLADSALAVDGRLLIPDPRFVGRFVPSFQGDARLKVDAAAHLRGTRSHPDGFATLHLTAENQAFTVPALDGRLDLRSGVATAVVRGGKGITAGPVRFDTLSATYAATSNKPFPASVALALRGPDLEIAERARLSQGSALDVETDTLGLRFEDRSLGSRRPFGLRFASADSGLAVRGLDLEGSLGSVKADGVLSPQNSRMRADILLHPPKQSPLLAAFRVPVESLPESISVGLRAEGANTFQLALGAGGISFAGESPTSVRVDLAANPGGLGATFHTSAGKDTTARGTAQLPVRVVIYPFKAGLEKGPLTLDATFSGFPLPIQPEEDPKKKKPAQLDGRLEARGTAEAPATYFEGTVRFPKWDRLDRYTLRIAALTLPPSGAGFEVKALVEPQSLLRIKQTGVPPSGVAAALSLDRDKNEVLSGTFDYPVTWSLIPPKVPAAPTGPMRLSIDSPGLDLEDFDGLLPPSTSLKGTLQLHFAAEGDPKNPKLDGKISSGELSASMSDGTRVDAEANVSIGGTAHAPTAAGTIGVHHGVIMVPSAPPNLLPAEGPAMLWDLERAQESGRNLVSTGGSTGAAGNEQANPTGSGVAEAHASTPPPTSPPPSSGAGAPGGGASRSGGAGTTGGPSGGGPPGASAPPGPMRNYPPPAKPGQVQIQPSYDVTVEIPGGLYVRGQGLDVQLSGNLHVVQQGPKPTISGELTAVGGTFELLGHQFQIDHGTVTFYGGDEIDPTLDLSLSSYISQTQITVKLTGTAQVPQLALSSSPEMSEGDIMSLIVFGVPMSELNTAQFNLLESRASQVATSYATAALASRLARQLGVDILSIEQTQGPQQQSQSALVVGKYLSPKVLLKYEQVLSEGGNILLDLQYFLTHRWTLDSLIGWQTQSGFEVRWTDER